MLPLWLCRLGLERPSGAPGLCLLLLRSAALAGGAPAGQQSSRDSLPLQTAAQGQFFQAQMQRGCGFKALYKGQYKLRVLPCCVANMVV